MSKNQFNDLVSRIEPLITKKNTIFQHVTVTDKEKTLSPTMFVAIWRHLDTKRAGEASVFRHEMFSTPRETQRGRLHTFAA
jgi:hypothetical protein